MQNGRNHFIQNLDYEDAKRIYRERGVELSTLEELLELASQNAFPILWQLEIKVPLRDEIRQSYDFKRAVEKTYEAVRQLDMLDRVSIISFDTETILHVKEIAKREN